MAFIPRHYATILSDMLTYVAANTNITDQQIGGVVRSILEAAALEDDAQYFACLEVLESFSIFNASGTDLIRRVAEWDVTPLQASSSVGKIVVSDGLLVSTELSMDELAASTSVNVEDSSEFATSYPYTIRIGEGTLQVEDVVVSNNDTGTNILTTGALTNNHSVGARVSLVTGAADQTIAAGLQVQVPAVGDDSAVVFTTIESGTIVNGNKDSTPIRARAVVPGVSGNVGTGRISQFTSSAPFGGATVTNTTTFGSGRPVESNEELRSRALMKRQSASRGTTLALKESVLGVTDPVTSQRTVFVDVLEDFDEDEVIVYIDDGTGFVPDQVQLGTTVLDDAVIVGAGTIEIVDADDFPDEGYIIISPENASQIELVEYSAIDRTVSPPVVSLVTNTANAHDAADEVVLVDVLTLDADVSTNYFNTYDFPLVRNSDRLWMGPTATSLVLQDDATEYILKRGLGRIQLVGSGTTAGDIVVTTYSYYTGLISTCQRIINGVETDEVNFPGVYTAGVPVVVETPTIRRITIRLSITAVEGKDEDDIAPIVQSVIETYISSLGIGNDVIVSEIIERAMRVPGMYNVVVVSPTSDLAIAEGELPVPYNAQGNSLVTVQ